MGGTCFVVKIGPGNVPPEYEFDPTSCPPELAKAILTSVMAGGGQTRITVHGGDQDSSEDGAGENSIRTD